MFIHDLIQTLDRALASVERLVAIALTAALTAIMIAQVILRYFFNSPLFWAEEIAVQLLVFITLIGLSLLVHAGHLVTIDFLSRALGDTGRGVLAIVLGLGFLVLLTFVAKLGWDWVMRPDVRMELGATTQLPRWYNYSLLPGAMLAMAFHQFAAVLRQVRALAGARA
ncbi:TRAP transporter small permease [Azoarcus olearius]|uniref:TRAP transporter small permease protein n=1 Tax=Azoarcus sp. (strain BH72) TaxID=418699 RepID=A1K887_AZOSB|nr:TRAP transporter small permease [Azoarcus olearius]ANQ85599.1 putative TRAP-type C4-dicarboxylate transport system small permease [Azoarcus olearius]CAL95042.1 putative TRAP-type C4-dicarboxylate transport system, small permease component [Azoarcus olearius]